MKKLCLLIAVLLGVTANGQVQDHFEVGINAGFPVGSSSDFTSFAFYADLNYLFEVAPKFELGLATGFTNLFGKDVSGIEVSDIQYIPVAAAAKYSLASRWKIGVDIGYGIGVSDGANGGFYFKPQVEFAVSDKVSVVASNSNWYEENFGESTSFPFLGFGVRYRGDGFLIKDDRYE